MALDEYMSIESDAPVSDLLVLHQGGARFSQQPYVRTEESVWGVPTKLPQYASSIDTEGPTLTGVSMGPREKQFIIACQGATKTLRLAGFQELYRVVESINRLRGGWLTVRRKGLTKTTRYRIVFADVTEVWSGKAARTSVHPAHLVLVCKPYGYLPSMTVEDSFDTPSLTAGDWTFDASSAATITEAAGYLTPNGSLGTERRLVRSAEGYEYDDVQVQVQFNAAATPTGIKVGGILRRLSDTTYLEAYVDVSGGVSRARIDAVVAGVRTNLASDSDTILQDAYQYTLRARARGNTVHCVLYRNTAGSGDEPAPLQGSPDSGVVAESTAVLTGTPRSTLGKGVSGDVGVVWTPVHATERLQSVRIARVYDHYATAWTGTTFPTVLRVPALHGDAPADLNIRFSAVDTVSPQLPRWAMVASWPKQEPVNRVPHPGFEYGGSVPWTAAAVAGLTSAATSINGTTVPYTGKYSGVVQTTATLGSGVAIPIYGGPDGEWFRAGEPVRVRARLYSALHTTSMVVGVGVSGDTATSTPAALSTSWVEHTATWYPATDQKVIYVYVKTNAAAATTLYVDAVVVDDGVNEPADGAAIGGNPFYGAYAAANVISLTNMTVQANASYRHGYGPRSTSTTCSVDIPIVPSIAKNASDNGDTLLVELWARLEIAATVTSGTISTKLVTGSAALGSTTIDPIDRPATAAIPVIVAGTFRVMKLGTFAVPVRDAGLEHWAVRIAATGVASGTFGIDWIVAVPALRRAAMPTGLTAPDTTIFSTGTDFQIATDLVAQRVGSTTWGARSVFGGARQQLDVDGSEVLAWVSDYVPDNDDTTVIGSVYATTELGITPKVAIHEAD